MFRSSRSAFSRVGLGDGFRFLNQLREPDDSNMAREDQLNMDSVWRSSRSIFDDGSNSEDDTAALFSANAFINNAMASSAEHSATPAAAAAATVAAAACFNGQQQQQQHQNPEEAWRLSLASLGSSHTYGYAMFPISEILYNMHAAGFFEDIAPRFLPPTLRRWLSPSPLHAAISGHGVFRSSMGTERGIKFEGLLLRMLHDFEKPLSPTEQQQIVPSRANSLSISPLTTQLMKYDIALDPWRNFLRGMCLAMARNDLYVDLPSLSQGIIYADPRLVGSIAPPLLQSGGGPGARGSEEGERGVIWGSLLLGAAAEFGSPAVCIHGLEVLQKFSLAAPGDNLETSRLLSLVVSNSARREQDWKFRSISGAAAWAPQLRSYFATVDRDRARAAAAAQKKS